MAQFENLSIAHCPKEANKVANWVAKAHRGNYLSRDWLIDPPSTLWDLIVSEARVFCYEETM